MGATPATAPLFLPGDFRDDSKLKLHPACACNLVRAPLLGLGPPQKLVKIGPHRPGTRGQQQRLAEQSPPPAPQGV